ncbi:MAG TPA: hypothetical protein VKC63_07975 [Solirubrobacterales bacterium]|nr:hypothetical protein [Solirubrobacterales bacterium]
MARHRRIALPLLAALVIAALTLGVTACGYSSDSKSVVEGESVSLGDLKYTVIFSRFLNPRDSEDSAYLVGQPQLPPGQSYFGVFFEIQNESDKPQSLPRSLEITDAAHKAYHSLDSESLYALPFEGEVEPEEQIPVLDSTPQQGPIEGSLVIFRLPASASESRPLTLHIPGPEPESAEVTLDL